MIHQPCSVIVAGPSGSGKSELVEQVLKDKKLFYPPPKKVLYCYDRWQPRFDRMKKQSKVTFYKGLPPEGALAKWFKPQDHGILILDDLMEEGGSDKRVLDLFTKDSHHRGITALYLTQDLFPPGKFAKTINRNAHYVICFKCPRDKTGIRQEPITRSLHMCCTLESTLSDEELFLEQAFPRKYIVSENVRILPS